MFSLASGIYQSYFAPPKLSILIIGLDGSGKTSLVERVKVTDISTRLEVGASSSLPASYAKGGALAGVGPKNNNGSGNNEPQLQPQPRPQRHQRGGQSDAGKPARLPPPLPPKQKLKSSQLVEKIMKDGFSPEGGDTAIAENDFLQGVPPPPLVASGNSDVSMDITSGQYITPEDGHNKASVKQVYQEPAATSTSTNDPLCPPISPFPPLSTPVLDTPSKKSKLIQLLRCPSPGKYSDAALGEEEEEEYHDNNPATTTTTTSSSVKDALEPWSTEYLRDYYINYQEGEEFDIKQPRVGGGGNAKKMFPMNRIRPTLGQNLAKLDLCGCKCSLFDLSGAEKMRPLWDRYYRDTDAIIYVVNAADTSFSNLQQSRREFERLCQNDALQRRVQCGLPILIFANQLDVAYKEYETSMERANNENNGRGISWNADEEDDFVGGGNQTTTTTTTTTQDDDDVNDGGVSKRVVDFHDLATIFGFPQNSSYFGDDTGHGIDNLTPTGSESVFLFGGSAKSGEGVRAAMEYLVAHAKSYHLARHARK
ncbi:hypothetical protein ACHAXR_003507 [Thalassiosira sp. AJA248-18]